jgi:hypothetical protein
MPATKHAPIIRPLCYEHHVQMRPCESLSHDEPLVYACRKPACFLHYSCSRGYFVNSKDVDITERDGIACVHCPRDWSPMYLLEVHPERRSYRLWRCPKCNTSRVSGELS